MEYRYGDRPRRDADDLLLNGFFKTTRAQSTSSAPTNTLRPPSRTPSRSPALASIHRSPKNIPPRPTCEDEVVALAKEVPGAHITALHAKDHEPPFRGTIDQQPIILESNISAADAAKLHKKLNTECEIEDSGERRYVLIPRDDTHSPIRDDEEASRRSNTAPLEVKPSRNDDGGRSLGKDKSPAHPLERRRSRQDLPALDTEMPSSRRSTSAYAYTPAAKQSAKSPRPESGEFLRSPGVPQGHSPSKGYFDLPTNVTSRQSPASSGTPIVDKRKIGGQPSSRPTTPLLEKRNSGGPDTAARLRQDLVEKLAKARQLSTGTSSQRPERALSAQGHLNAGDHSRHRKSSSRSSHNHYSSSDDDQDSSDSERRRRRHHHHHKHNPHDTLRPDEDRDRHHRSGSKSTLSSDGKSVSRPGSRVTSPLASPFASPNISPSQLPPVEKADTLRNANHSSGRDSGRDSGRENRRPSARPVSPLTPLPASTRSINTLDPSNNPTRSRARSRSRPRSRQSSPTRNPTNSTLPIPIPTRIDVNTPGDTRRSPVIPQYDEEGRPSSARPSTSEKPYWQPPSFQPPSDSAYLERPVGSYRRYSQDVDEGTIAPLPPCPRTKATRGYADWLTLPRCPEDSFNICPSCFDSTIAPTEFHNHFVASPVRSAHADVLCDFGSQPWYRIAWLLTRKEHRKDLRLISSLAEIADKVPPCLGKHEAVRHWYSVIDPRTGNLIRNFDVCYSCVRSIEILLPALKGQFVRTDHKGPPGLPRVCDMRFDSKRFVHYFDALETAADSTENSYPLDITEFADLAKRYAAIPECPRDETLTSTYWYMITQLPEFSICPECYDEVVLPELERQKAIPAMFNKSMQRLPSASCQLYSPRMRAIFGKAVSGNDYKFLASMARERRMREVEFKKDIADQRRLGKGGEKETKRIEKEWLKWE